MPIDRITFKRNYSVSLILHEHVHLGLEYSLNEGENAMDVLKYCDQFVKEGFNELFGNQVTGISIVADNKPVPEIHVEKKSVLNYGDQIRASKTVDELKEFKIISDMNPKLTAIYNETLSQLTNK